MKRILLLLFLGSVLFTFKAEACIDPVNDPTVTTNYDTVMIGRAPMPTK